MRLRFVAPAWGYLPALAVALVCVTLAPAMAQPKKPAAPAKDGAPAGGGPTLPPGDPAKGDVKIDPKTKKPKTFDFTALDLNGRMRSPQLLYFLERANEELERASLEKRSFIPHMVRSLEEEQL
jgi:hypothetical protein